MCFKIPDRFGAQVLVVAVLTKWFWRDGIEALSLSERATVPPEVRSQVVWGPWSAGSRR